MSVFTAGLKETFVSSCSSMLVGLERKIWVHLLSLFFLASSKKISTEISLILKPRFHTENSDAKKPRSFYQ